MESFLGEKTHAASSVSITAGPSLSTRLHVANVNPYADEGNVVNFDGIDDPYDPVAWPVAQKWGVLLMVATMTLITPLSPSMLASALPELFAEYPPSSSFQSSLSVSIYALGLAVGPLLVAPLAECFGRLPLYHATAVLFIIFSIACAVSSSLEMMIAFEFFQGCAGAAPITIGGGSVADMFAPGQRGSRIALLAVGPLLAVIVGPVSGSFLAAAHGWRWVFWLVAILAAGVELGYCLLMRETYPPTLLERKTRNLRRETGNTTLRSALGSDSSLLALVIRSFVRPFKILFLLPAVLGLCILVSIAYSYYFLLTTTLAGVFITQYGLRPKIVGLVFLGIGVGMAIGAISFAILSDWLLRRDVRRGAQTPEGRLKPMILGSVAVPAGLFLYGWSAEYSLHWFVPILGTAFIGAGLMWLLLSFDTYLVDAYPLYAASAIGATTVFRSVLSAFLPLAGPAMYARLGLGWANSLLAFIAIILIPIPFLFLKYGEWIRNHPLFIHSL